MYKLLITKKATKFIKLLPTSKRKIIKQKFNLLIQNPYPNQSLDIKKMKGYSDIYRLRIGKYRFIYELKEKELIILVMTVGFRGNVYKRF
ncbi:MAG: type II toxin-antitoxin system RelE/ParE family toxin [Bacteroidales bacterium]|nr:type II toxin-antitoxin system RelE/ParE family toxin [Bacteroidales bacterium]